MTKEFKVFLRDFDRNEAKVFWEEHKEDLLSLLDREKEHIQEQVNKIRHLAGELFTELGQICDGLEAIVDRYRSKCHFTNSELPPFLIWQIHSKIIQRAAESELPP